MIELLGQRGSRTFLWIWLGETVSLFGTSLTAFALAVYVYERTGSVTPLTLTMLSSFVPQIILGPFAGVIVDRINRKWAMLAADVGEGMAVLLLLALLAMGQLQIWMVYPLVAAGAASSTMQRSAQAATISLLLPAEQFGRADGLLEFGEGLGMVVAPAVAGVLVLLIGISRVLSIDLATYIFDALILVAVHIPHARRSDANPSLRDSFLQDMAAGWHYIRARPGLRRLFTLAGIFNLVGPVTTARLMTPLVLSQTSGNTVTLGVVSSAWGMGMVVGGAVMGVSGGPRPRIRGFLGAAILTGMVNQILFGLGHSLPFWALATFAGGLLSPIQGGSSQAIWQSKVEPALQGRVFALRRVNSQLMACIGLLLIGPLTDKLFTPAVHGSLGSPLQPLLGEGPGRGYSLAFVVFGLMTVLVSATGYFSRSLRGVETEVLEPVSVTGA